MVSRGCVGNITALLNQRACVGKYRTFDLSYLHQLLDALVTNATIEGLDLENMEIEKAQACILQLEDIPQSVVNGCLDAFCDRLGNNRLTLNKDRVCRFLGQAALASERGKEWRLEEFLDVWKALVPDIFAVEMDMLRGLYIVSERVVTQQRRQQYITYFPVNELPTDPAQRFARLFTEKKRWTEQEIVPYLEDLAPDAKKRDALLLKYTRTQRDHGTLYYGTKIK